MLHSAPSWKPADVALDADLGHISRPAGSRKVALRLGASSVIPEPPPQPFSSLRDLSRPNKDARCAIPRRVIAEHIEASSAPEGTPLALPEPAELS